MLKKTFPQDTVLAGTLFSKICSAPPRACKLLRVMKSRRVPAVFRVPAVLAACVAAALFFAFPQTPAAAADEAPAAAPRYNPGEWANLFPKGLVKIGQNADALDMEMLLLLDGKFVGAYNANGADAASRTFTLQLIEFYKKNRDALEIVYCPGEKSQREMMAHIRKTKMKWLALPFGVVPVNSIGLSGRMPQFIVFSPDSRQFAVVTGTKDLQKKLGAIEREMRRWLKKYAAPADAEPAK